MSSVAARFTPIGAGLVLVLCALLFLARPEVSPGQVPTASVTVCQVQGSAGAPGFAQVTVSVDQVAAYLNQHPGSFVGSCPASDGGSSGQAAPPLTGAVTVCRVSGSASAPILSQVVVGADQVAAYLNQNRGSFAGPCPASSGGGNAGGSDGTGPLNAVVTVCRVTGNVQAPGLAQLNLAVDEVAAFLNQNGRSFVGHMPGPRRHRDAGTRTDPRDPGRRGALDLPSRRGRGRAPLSPGERRDRACGRVPEPEPWVVRRALPERRRPERDDRQRAVRAT